MSEGMSQPGHEFVLEPRVLIDRPARNHRDIKMTQTLESAPMLHLLSGLQGPIGSDCEGLGILERGIS